PEPGAGAPTLTAQLPTTGPADSPGVEPAPSIAGPVLSDIRVEGSQRVDPGTVLSYMRLKAGDRYDRERLDESLKALYATGYFKDVQFRRDGAALVVVVQENPVINRIVFEGNKRIEDETLAAEMQLKPRLVYTVARAQTDAQRIVEIYRRSGRFSVTVEPKLIELEQNRVDLVFEIDEGELTEIHRIVFIGNKRFSDGQLRSEINTEETRWYRFLSSSDIYDPDRLAFDQELLRKFYLRNGYVDFQVISAIAELAPDREGFIITFTLEEGEQYDVASIDVVSRLKDLDGAALKPYVEVEVGDAYNIDDVDATVDALTDEVGRYGYAFVDVRPRVTRRTDEKKVDIVFEIGEGPRVYVERINIVGNVRTLDEVIRREMQLAEGDAFNRAKIRESERRIRRLGFFEKVSIENRPSDAADRTIVTVEVVEQSTGELSFGAGVSSDSGLLANASIRERNLLGRGQDLLLSFGLSFDDAQLDLSFTEPYFLNRPLSAGIDAFASEQDREDESNFQQKSVGGGFRIGYELARRWRQTWGYQLRQDDIEADDDASRFILAQEGKAITSRVSHRLSFDNTDNFFSPSEGMRFTMDNAVAGLGGDVSYFSTELKGSIFFPVAEQTVLSFSGRTGGITGLADDVRLNDRYFLGGTSFRGFAV
ncbi:MAG: outer membrane protein assembly factor BamA, partial [Alphaproteobacteria bacterium]